MREFDGLVSVINSLFYGKRTPSATHERKESRCRESEVINTKNAILTRDGGAWIGAEGSQFVFSHFERQVDITIARQYIRGANIAETDGSSCGAFYALLY